VRFQELLLNSKLLFISGMAGAKSKGRGEECISQNLRIFRGHNGKLVMLFFANSQRKEFKRYVSIPRESTSSRVRASNHDDIANSWLVNCIGAIKPPKKDGRPVTIDLNPNFDLLSSMRNLTIQFIDDDGQCTFDLPVTLWLFSCPGIGLFIPVISRLQSILPGVVMRPDDWMITLRRRDKTLYPSQTFYNDYRLWMAEFLEIIGCTKYRDTICPGGHCLKTY
jgi:hypothetical protein